MIQKLTKQDDGWALILDQGTLEKWKVDPNSPLEVTTNEETLIITPIDDPERKAKFQQALEETNQRYGEALKRMA